MTHFMPYIDKENSSQLGVLTPLSGARPKTGPVGKTFQTSSFHHSNIPRKSSSFISGGDKSSNLRELSARKALGRLNISSTTQKNTQKQQSGDTFLKPPRPASKHQKLSVRQSEANQQQKHQTSAPQTKRKAEDPCYPEIERIPIFEEEEDKFEDVWRSVERPDSYIPEIRSWRPCRFSLYNDPSEDQHSLLPDHNSSAEEDVQIQDLTVEEPEFDVSWEDITDFSKLPSLALPPLNDPFDDTDTIAMLE